MKKELVISFYDGGVNWSFSSGNRVYTKDKYESGCYNHQTKIKTLCYFLHQCQYTSFSLNLVAQIVYKLYPECSKIIWCEDGFITMKTLMKGGE